MAALKRFDFVELLVLKNDKVCAIGFEKKNLYVILLLRREVRMG